MMKISFKFICTASAVMSLGALASCGQNAKILNAGASYSEPVAVSEEEFDSVSAYMEEQSFELNSDLEEKASDSSESLSCYFAMDGSCTAKAGVTKWDAGSLLKFSEEAKNAKECARRIKSYYIRNCDQDSSNGSLNLSSSAGFISSAGLRPLTVPPRNVVCPVGRKADKNGFCVLIGYTAPPSQPLQVVCNPPKKLVGSQCVVPNPIPVTTCSAGYSMIDGRCQQDIVIGNPVQQPKCLAGQVLQTGKCVATTIPPKACPTGQVLSSNGVTCVVSVSGSCPSGQTPGQGGKCIPASQPLPNSNSNPSGCPAGTTPGQSGKCINPIQTLPNSNSNPSGCPAGTTPGQNGKCIAR